MSGKPDTQIRNALSMFGRKPGTSILSLHPTTTLVWLAGISLLVVPMVTLVDVSLAQFFATGPLPREVCTALDMMRLFSHGWGVFLILSTIMLLSPPHRWHVPRLAALAMGGGAVATLAKMFVLRPRPNELNLNVASYNSAWLWEFDWSLEHVAAYDASTRAFPSGNMATAVAFAVGLWIILPRGRWLFAGVCLGTLFQRLYCGSHFLSDLFGGAAFGFLWAYVCWHPGLLGKIFDQMQPDEFPRSVVLPQASETAEVPDLVPSRKSA